MRDKIGASKRKGLWGGGMAPLGYDTKDRRITVNEPEAETVRTIFRSYLKLGSLNLLMADLRKRGIVAMRLSAIGWTSSQQGCLTAMLPISRMIVSEFSTRLKNCSIS